MGAGAREVASGASCRRRLPDWRFPGRPRVAATRPAEQARGRLPCERAERIDPIVRVRPSGRAAVMDAILDAATELFADRGPNAVTVRSIAERAGINHALVHRYFGTKEDLIGAVVGARAGALHGARRTRRRPGRHARPRPAGARRATQLRTVPGPGDPRRVPNRSGCSRASRSSASLLGVVSARCRRAGCRGRHRGPRASRSRPWRRWRWAGGSSATTSRRAWRSMTLPREQVDAPHRRLHHLGPAGTAGGPHAPGQESR